jgi:membrane associated rhomboid family serine protease
MSYSEYFEYERTQIRPPRVTWAVQRLIMANVAVFVVQLLAGPVQYLLFSNYAFASDFPGGMLNIWFGFQPNLFFDGLVWKPFTYMFLHSGLLHVGFNMLWLYFFGPDVERRLGTMPFFRFYIVCGGVGVLLTCLPYLLGVMQVAGAAANDGRITVVGASGAVMGVMVAFAIIAPDRQIYMLPLPWPITARTLVVIVVILNIVMGLNNTTTSVATHLGGVATGFAYMKLYPMLSRKGWRPGFGAGVRRRQDPPNKVGEAVDNIFKFKDPDRR